MNQDIIGCGGLQPVINRFGAGFTAHNGCGKTWVGDSRGRGVVKVGIIWVGNWDDLGEACVLQQRVDGARYDGQPAERLVLFRQVPARSVTPPRGD